MTFEEWEKIKHFKPTSGDGPGSWGNPLIIKKELVTAMDAWVDLTKCVTVVTYGTQGKHEPNSEHYDGFASDVVIIPCPTTPTLFDAFVAASRFGFTSIGLYRDWSLNGVVRGGLHLGMRPQPYRKLWIGIKENGKTQYLALNAENLKKYSFL